MCWLPIEQPLLLPGDSTCSAHRASHCCVAQVLASRLRRIGDQLEKSRTEREREADGGCSYGDTGQAVVTARGHLRRFLSTAIHLTALVLLVTRRHL